MDEINILDTFAIGGAGTQVSPDRRIEREYGPAVAVRGPYYTIREASKLTQVPAHVLRYWEMERLLDPSRTSKGHRRYRQYDIERIIKIKELCYIKGMRSQGIRKHLSEEARKKKKEKELPLEFATSSAALLSDIKRTVREMLKILENNHAIK
ncbi:MerR family transcriptional regulator [Elusimicrobiota bacterium]